MDLMALSARLTLDTKNYDQGLAKAAEGADGFAKQLSAKTVAIGQFMGNMMTKVVTRAFSTIKNIIGGATDAFADWEQLVGGVETLFGTRGAKDAKEYGEMMGLSGRKAEEAFGRAQMAQEYVVEHAKEAYKTVGVSANKYLETATSFSAALTSSLHGDLVKSAEYTDMAMVDMADNANKMGSTMESVENAYKGFAKGNYTMLDNLKLGYGGTKEEMKRLLKDAGKLSGKKYNLENFSDIIEAIHVIQENKGISGTTAKEAATTITGSKNMLIAAWQNVLAALGDPENFDISEVVQNLIDSAKTYLDNLLPTVGRVLNGLGDFVAAVLPEIMEKLPEIIVDFAPKIWKAIKAAVVGLGKGLKKAFAKIKLPTWEDVKAKFKEAWQTVKNGFRKIAVLIFGEDEDGGIKWPSISEIWNKVKNGLSDLWKQIKEKAKDILILVFGEDEKGGIKWPTWDDVKTAATTAWNTIKKGIDDLGKLVFGIDFANITSVDELLSTIRTKWTELKDTVSNKAIEFAKYFFGNEVDGEKVGNTIKLIADALLAIGTAIVTYSLVKNLESVFSSIRNLFTMDLTGKSKIGLILAAIAAVVMIIYEHWDDIQPKLVEFGNWFTENIITPVSKFFNDLREWVERAIRDIKRFFGITDESHDEKLFTNIFGDFSREDMNLLQEYIDKYNEYQHKLQELNDLYNEGKVGTEEYKAAEKELDKLEKEQQELFDKISNTTDATGKNLYHSYTTWKDELGWKEGDDIPDAPVNLIPEAQQLQGAINDLPTLTARVELIPDYSSATDMSGWIQKHRNQQELPGHEKGGLIPYDNYIARLHRGERVLTASQARRYREGSDVDISAVYNSVASAVKEGMKGAKVDSYMDGNLVTKQTNRVTGNKLAARRFATSW